MDKLIDHVSTKEETETNDVHHSTTKCKSSFKDKYIRLFPIGRRFANYRQLEQYINLFFEKFEHYETQRR